MTFVDTYDNIVCRAEHLAYYYFLLLYLNYTNYVLIPIAKFKDL